jgi:hypothetical protein
MTQDVCRSKHRGNPESEAANERVSPSKADLRYRILRFFFERGPSGATCEQASIALAIRYTTASAKISELKAEGLLAFTGERGTTSGGSSAALLRAVTSQYRERKVVQLNLLEISIDSRKDSR